MAVRVVDASAVGALLFGEEAGPWVRDQTADQELIAPALLPFELGNVCWVKIRRNPNEADALLRAWTNWTDEPPVTIIEVDLMGTLQLARMHNLTFYDATYLWLASDQGADLISLDAALVGAARAIGLHAPSRPR